MSEILIYKELSLYLECIHFNVHLLSNKKEKQTKMITNEY
jgi:hypothetical protein